MYQKLFYYTFWTKKSFEQPQNDTRSKKKYSKIVYKYVLKSSKKIIIKYVDWINKSIPLLNRVLIYIKWWTNKRESGAKER